MSKFKKSHSKEKPTINTSSLPDIIFMLLFFFMIVTVFREQLLVEIQIPKATELNKLKHKSLTHNIYIGKPVQNNDALPRIQIDDAFINLENITEALKRKVAEIPETLQPLLTTNLKIDQNVKMGIVNDVKIEIRKANQLKLNYAAIARVDGF